MIFLFNLLAQRIINPAANIARSGSEFFSRLIPALVSLGFVIGSLVFLFILIVGAIKWMSSGGDKAQYEAARQKVGSALVGIVILFSVFAVLNLAECFFGIGLRKIRIGPFNIGFTNAPFCSSNPPIQNCGVQGDPCGALGQECCPGFSCIGRFCESQNCGGEGDPCSTRQDCCPGYSCVSGSCQSPR